LVKEFFKNKVSGLLLVLALLLYSNIINAESLTVTAAVNSEKIEINQQLIYKITISGEDIGSVPSPKLPNLRNKFNVISSSESTAFSWVNGKVSSSKTKQYIMLPIKEGHILLEPAQIKFKGNTYNTNSISVEVVASSGEPNESIPATNTASSEQPTNLASKNTNNVFTEQTIDTQKVYVGEQVVYRLNLFSRLQIFGDIVYEPPKFNNFWVEKVPLPANNQGYYQNIGNKRYHVSKLFKAALYPQKPGVITVSSAKAACQVSLYERKRVLQSKPLTIEVLPLPEDNKPGKFTGLVGDFNIDAVTDKKTVDQNTPIAVKITVSGEGNVKGISELVFEESPDLKIYKSKIEEQENTDGRLPTKRTFEYIIIPKVAGELSIPAFSMNFFSKKEKSYKLISTQAIPFSSIASAQPAIASNASQPTLKSDIEVIRNEIRYLHTGVDITKEHSYLYKSKIYIGLVVVNIILYIFYLLFLIRKYLIKNNKKTTLKNKAVEIAVKKISSVGATYKKDHQVISTLQNIFLEFLSNKTGEAFMGLTNEEIEVALEKHGLETKATSACLDILQKLAFFVYAPASVNEDELGQVIKDTKALIKKLAKWN
jgi:hypothetical protein